MSAENDILPGPGTVLDGKYKVLRELGRGAMGAVYEVRHQRLGQNFAVKVVLPEMLLDPDLVKRFEREARAAATLKSAHVARVVDVANTPQGLPYMVMELLDGHDLETALEDGPLPYGEAVDYILQACAAIGEAHAAGIVHRDLKPANMFLAKVEDGAIVKVLDFGISKSLHDDAKLTSTKDTVGTPLYMSPEQIRSSAVVDGRADIWSLGVMLYELVSGRTPWTGTTPQIAIGIVSDPAPSLDSVAAVPAPLAAVVKRMLAKDRNERYATIAEVAAALVPFCRPGAVGEAAARALARRSESQRDLQAAFPAVTRVVSGSLSPQESRAATLIQDGDQAPKATETSFATQPGGARPALGMKVVGVAAVLAVALAVTGFAVVRSRARDPVATTSAGSPVVADPSKALPSATAPARGVEVETPSVASSVVVATPPASANANANVGGGNVGSGKGTVVAKVPVAASARPAPPAVKTSAPPAGKNPAYLE